MCGESGFCSDKPNRIGVRAAGALWALAVWIAPNAQAQMTQPQATQDCESRMPAKYAESVAFYGAAHLNGWRCVMPDPVMMPTTVQGQVNLDIYGTTNFTWTGTSVYSIYSLTALDFTK